jgi:hypothetical protein
MFAFARAMDAAQALALTLVTYPDKTCFVIVDRINLWG